MILYTEEQVLNSMLSMKTYIEKYDESVIDTIVEKHLKSLGGIELPSDDAGKEMSYSNGYAEGYKRALEVIEWYIKNHISGMVQDHIGEDNKMVGGKQ